MHWRPGKQLSKGRYTILGEPLGKGGFAITYRAKDEQQGNDVVIKTLNREAINASNYTQINSDFRAEATKLRQLTNKLNHHHIVRYENVFIAKQGARELPCIVMEYIEGETLDQRVKQAGILKETEALGYISQIGQALHDVHKQELLHRDIKPQNIMVRKATNQAVLIDFGIARDFIPDVTLPQTRLLTPGYAPPEQHREKARWGPFTDVYALAATLYYLLTGEKPISAPDREDAIFYRRRNDPLQEANKINSNVSNTVNQAIIRGMELDERKRPQIVQEWLELLANSKALELLANSKALASKNQSFLSNTPSTATVAQRSNSGEFASLEQSIHQQINQHRQSRNLPPLTLDSRITEQARNHSQAMASGQVPFSHEGFNARAEALAPGSAAENIAYDRGSSNPAKQAVQGWLKSSGHSQNICGKYDLTGIGVATNNKGEYYLTQIFLKRH